MNDLAMRGLQIHLVDGLFKQVLHAGTFDGGMDKWIITDGTINNLHIALTQLTKRMKMLSAKLYNPNIRFWFAKCPFKRMTFDASLCDAWHYSPFAETDIMRLNVFQTNLVKLLE